MKETGIFITEEERQSLETNQNWFLSGGIPMADPGGYAMMLEGKYNPPPGAGINLKTGEWMVP